MNCTTTRICACIRETASCASTHDEGYAQGVAKCFAARKEKSSISQPVTSEQLTLKRGEVLAKDISDIIGETAGGIILTDQAKDRQKYRQWEIVRVSEGTPLDLQAGIRVMVDGRFAGTPLELDDGTFRLLDIDRIIAIITGE